MTDSSQIEQSATNAIIKSKRGFSLVWIVPMVALVIGGWLAIKAFNEKGPTVTITFSSAEGLEAGKTKIKYRDVEVGQVEKIMLAKDVSKVVVTAKMVKGSEAYLTDQTNFWVVRPRVHGGSVSGLGTFLSGAYIGIGASRKGQPARTFTGMEVPPMVTLDQPGRHFKLHAETLGSLDIGAPVYYRQIQVGQVVGYGFDQDGKAVDIEIFIEAPHYTRVTESTRFWNASGINVTLNAQGLKVDTQSVVSIISGGIAFDEPKDATPGSEAKENATFELYADRADIQEKKYSNVRTYWMLLFDQSVRGLSVGAPVELYGVKVGEVVNFNLEFDASTKKFLVPVVIAIERERIRIINKIEMQKLINDPDILVKTLVEQQGLRAQLQSGNLLTGQLMVNLVFVPDAQKVSLSHREGYTVVPTIPGSFEPLQENLAKIITKLNKVPFDQVGEELQRALKDAQNTLKQIGGLAENLNKETAPQLKSTIAELQKTLVELQRSYGKESPLNYNARNTLEELTQTLRSFRELVDTLEKRPNSIIFGKEKESHE